MYSRFQVLDSEFLVSGTRILHSNLLRGTVRFESPGFRIPPAKNVLDYGIGIVTYHGLMQTPSCEKIAGPKSKSELSKEAQQFSFS